MNKYIINYLNRITKIGGKIFRIYLSKDGKIKGTAIYFTYHNKEYSIWFEDEYGNITTLYKGGFHWYTTLNFNDSIDIVKRGL